MSRPHIRRADALASPIAFPRNMRRPSRAEVEAMVEGLIEYLDGLDGDPDREPSLGAPEPYSWQGQTIWGHGSSDDRENAECVDCDGEPIVHVPALMRAAA